MRMSELVELGQRDPFCMVAVEAHQMAVLVRVALALYAERRVDADTMRLFAKDVELLIESAEVVED